VLPAGMLPITGTFMVNRNDQANHVRAGLALEV
jgi:hypothetical protein